MNGGYTIYQSQSECTGRGHHSETLLVIVYKPELIIGDVVSVDSQVGMGMIGP